MRMGPNQVLIRLDRRQNEYKMKKGGHLYIDTTFEPEKHAPITGHIVNICDKLVFSQKKSQAESLQWETEIDLEVGDYVVSYYLAAHNAGSLNDGRMMVVEGKTFIILRYDQIFAARADTHPLRGPLVTCNGFNLLKPVKDVNIDDRLERVGLHTPWRDRGNISSKVARMAYKARPNKAYWDRVTKDDPEMYERVSIGELVLVRKHSLIPLEYAYHTSLDGDQVYYRVAWHNIYATCDEQILG